MLLKVKTYPVEKVMAVSFAAHRKNSGYVKSTHKDDTGKIIWANKELVAYALSAQERDSGVSSHSWIHPEFTGLTVTDDDITNVEIAKNHVKRYMLGLISGNIGSFQKDVFSVISEDQIPVTRIALVSYVPELIIREISDKKRISRMKQEFVNSVHYDSSVSGVFEILKTFYMKDVGIHVYFGCIDQNLVSFTNVKKYEVGEKFIITGKVKKKDFCTETGLPQTRLNYVKIKKNDKSNKAN
jgi:hypothetical protein